MICLRLAAEQPERVTHLVVAGGFAESLLADPGVREARRAIGCADARRLARATWTRSGRSSSPSRTRPSHTRTAVRNALASDGKVIAMAREGWLGHDLRPMARRIRCPTLVIHGDEDGRVPASQRRGHREPGAGRAPAHHRRRRAPDHGARSRALSPSVCDFLLQPPQRRGWVRGMARKRRALFISSAIGLGHVQRDLAIAREMRDASGPTWRSTGSPSIRPPRYLEREGERLHPICSAPGQREPAFRAPGRRARPAGVLRAAHDGRGDGAQFPGLRRPGALRALRHRHRRRGLGGRLPLPREPGTEAPAVRLPDRFHRLPADGGRQRREAFLCADRNADDIEHVARYPWIRDRAIFVGNPEDLPRAAVRPGPAGHPRLDRPRTSLHRLCAAVRSGDAGRHRGAARAPRLPPRREAGHRRGRRHGRRRAAAAPGSPKRSPA